MAIGGGALVLGFVGWLWSIGIFENPLVVALILGVLTLSVLGAGIALIRRTRYQLAGQGLTLLASLAMPLNLWFYDAQELITIRNGGHLWIPAAICCGIYALVARVVRKPVFVHTLVGGVVLTGMLFLADQSVARFWELMPQVTFLVFVGWTCIFSERLFAEGDGDFSRGRFGKAFYRSGLVVLTAGFGLLLGGQLLANLGDMLPARMVPSIGTDRGQKLWALGLLVASTIAMGVETLSRSKRALAATTAILLAWSGICLLDVLQFSLQLPHFVIVGAVAVSALVFVSKDESAQGGLAVFAGLLGILSFLQFFATHILASVSPYFRPDNFLLASDAWILTIQLAVVAIACFCCWRQSASRMATIPENGRNILIDLAAVLVTLKTVSLALSLGVNTFQIVAFVSLFTPILLTAYVSLSATLDQSGQQTLRRIAASSTTAALLTLGLLSVSGALVGASSHGYWGGMLLAVGALYLVASKGETASPARLAGFVTATAGVSQLLAAMGLETEYSLIVAANVGGAALAATSAIRRRQLEFQARQHLDPDLVLATPVDKLEAPANMLVVAGSVIGILLTATRVLANEADLWLLLMLAVQLACIAFAGLLTRVEAWRLTFRATALASVVAIIAAINRIVDIGFYHQIELASLLGGIALLAIGHIAWYREGDTPDDSATTGLWFGSLLTVVPLALGLLIYRNSQNVPSEYGWVLFHEIAAVVVTLSLVGSGIACRIRSTTIAGVSLMTAYVVSLVMLIRLPQQLQNASVIMMIGGGSFFIAAILLSVYRDRIVSLHADLREKRGVFRVLKWR